MNLPSALKKDYVQTAMMIVAAILAVLIFWYSLTFILGTGNPILAVASESMEPVLYRGDLIIIEGVKNISDIHVGTKDSANPGDIIIFHEPQDSGELIVHRAVERIDNGDGTYSFRTWGDNNAVKDWWEVDQSEVVGRYLWKVPLLGHIALFFSPLEVKIAFVILWIIVLLTLELAPSVRKRLKNGGDEASLY